MSALHFLQHWQLARENTHKPAQDISLACVRAELPNRHIANNESGRLGALLIEAGEGANLWSPRTPLSRCIVSLNRSHRFVHQGSKSVRAAGMDYAR